MPKLQALLEPLLATGHGAQANLPLACKVLFYLKSTQVKEVGEGAIYEKITLQWPKWHDLLWGTLCIQFPP